MAYYFNGSTNGMTSGTVLIDSTPVSVSCWIRCPSVTSAATRRPFTVTSTSGLDRLGFFISTTGTIGLQVVGSAGSAGAANATTTATISANTWHHLSGFYLYKSNVTVYLDGENKNSNSNNREMVVSNLTQTVVGAILSSGSLSQYMAGDVAEIGVWSAQLTETELYSLSRGVKPISIRPESLKAYLPLIRDQINYTDTISFNDFSGGPSNHVRRYG